ncbi:hypothetical protein, partial [Streptomyces angustmyceticus]
LAAGQKYRDLLTEDLLDGLRDGSYESNPAAWKDLLDARGAQSAPACASAGWFAGRNDARLSGSGSGCLPGSWPTSFAVQVTTLKPVGNSVIPKTSSTHAEAGAKSVVAPRCTLDPAEDGPDAPDGKDDGGGKGGKDGKGKDDAAPLDLTCDTKHWKLDPDDLRDLPGAADLFSVRLAR